MTDKFVQVLWQDASYNSGYWDMKDEAEKFEPVNTSTVGHVVKSTKTKLIISHDRFYDHKGKRDDDRHISIIPRAMIREIRVLEHKKK